MFSSYEPELFPGLIYRMMKPKIVLLIFVSGKIVLTGAKVREEIYQAFELICKLSPMSTHSLKWSVSADCGYDRSGALGLPQDLNPVLASNEETASCNTTTNSHHDRRF